MLISQIIRSLVVSLEVTGQSKSTQVCSWRTSCPQTHGRSLNPLNYQKLFFPSPSSSHLTSLHLPTCSPLRMLHVQEENQHTAGGMLNPFFFFSSPTAPHKMQAHMLFFKFQLKKKKNTSSSALIPLFDFFFFLVRLQPIRGLSPFCHGSIACRYPLWLFQMS